MSKFRSAYDGKRNRVSVQFLDENGEQSIGKTEQHHKAECDINNVIKKYDKTGLITHVNTAKATYGDYTDINEYQESLNIVIKAENAFMEMPSSIRKKFGNDPGLFMEFISNPDNLEEMITLGIAERPITPVPMEVKIVADEDGSTVSDV